MFNDCLLMILSYLVIQMATINARETSLQCWRCETTIQSAEEPLVFLDGKILSEALIESLIYDIVKRESYCSMRRLDQIWCAKWTGVEALSWIYLTNHFILVSENLQQFTAHVRGSDDANRFKNILILKQHLLESLHTPSKLAVLLVRWCRDDRSMVSFFVQIAKLSLILRNID